uniref:(northern house mosquito) hypothetical protein n=1 Tax=Culex pipiens TaxID=7175 RepID=A0A8D8C9Q0_CULPI
MLRSSRRTLRGHVRGSSLRVCAGSVPDQFREAASTLGRSELLRDRKAAVQLPRVQLPEKAVGDSRVENGHRSHAGQVDRDTAACPNFGEQVRRSGSPAD